MKQSLYKRKVFQLVLLITLFVIFFDVLSKVLTLKFLAPLNHSIVVIPNVLSFTYVENTGAAFGIFSNSRWVFMSASIVFIVLLLYILKTMHVENKLFVISLSLILGGGISNMIDRVLLGFVVDFIELTFVDFAVFNIADSAITIGVVLFVIYLLFFDKTIISGKKEAKDVDKPML